jgi:hypothetical protein
VKLYLVIYSAVNLHRLLAGVDCLERCSTKDVTSIPACRSGLLVMSHTVTCPQVYNTCGGSLAPFNLSMLPQTNCFPARRDGRYAFTIQDPNRLTPLVI